MTRTPKSERRLTKTSAAVGRAGADSYAHLREDGHPAHKWLAEAMARYGCQHAHNARDYQRHVRREHQGRLTTTW